MSREYDDDYVCDYNSKTLRISGPERNVEQAKCAIEQLLKKVDRRTEQKECFSKEELDIPRSTLGFVIGKNGETIKRLPSESGARFHIKPDGKFLLSFTNTYLLYV
jgi:polyribonucleotide nucleotidyltransferase